MQRILYAGGVFFTDDDVARALMEYANVLAIVNSADVVTIPGVDDGGVVREITLIIGPASQIMAMGTEQPGADLETGDAVGELRGRAQARLPNAIGVVAAGDSAPAETDAESTNHDGD